MKTHNTILALQMENGVRVYNVQYMPESGKQPQKNAKTFSYKSAVELEPGTHVVVPVDQGRSFKVARVKEENMQVDFDNEYRLLWINQVVEDPVALYEMHNDTDVQAQRKLAGMTARRAAKDYLKDSGMEVSAFAPVHENSVLLEDLYEEEEAAAKKRLGD